MVTFQLAGGELALIAEGPGTLTDSSLALPGGVYTTLRTYHGDRVAGLDEHLARLVASAALLGRRPACSPAEVRAGLRAALARTGYAESRVRITEAFAAGSTAAACYIALEPLLPPEPVLYQQGVRTASLHMARMRPRAKSTEFIAIAAGLYARKPPGVYELLMATEQGAILEGLTSNFFGVRGGALYTADEGVLEGVTRSLVLRVAAERGLPVHHAPVMLAEVGALDEAFITSSSREIIPAIAVDAQRIGSGNPGPVSRALLADYRAAIERLAVAV